MTWINKLLLVTLMIFLVSCKGLTTIDDVSWISESPKIGYRKLIVDYNPRIDYMRIDYVPITPGKVYFISDGEYTLDYRFSSFGSLNLGSELRENEKKKSNSSKAEINGLRKYNLNIKTNTSINVNRTGLITEGTGGDDL